MKLIKYLISPRIFLLNKKFVWWISDGEVKYELRGKHKSSFKKGRGHNLGQ